MLFFGTGTNISGFHGTTIQSVIPKPIVMYGQFSADHDLSGIEFECGQISADHDLIIIECEHFSLS